MTLDAAWGPAPGDASTVTATALAAPGAVVDAAYRIPYAGHRVGAPGRRGIDLGWAPDGAEVLLSPAECALGLWRITFPAAGAYMVTLAGVGAIAVTAVAPPPARPAAQWTVTHPQPVPRAPSVVGVASYDGDYPAGGLALPPEAIGVGGVLFADVPPVGALQFSWQDGLLRVYTAGAEVSGTIAFSAPALFLGE